MLSITGILLLSLTAQHVWAQEVLPQQDDLASFWDYLAYEYFPWLKEGWDKSPGLAERGLNVADPNDLIPDVAATILVAVITTILAAFVIVRLVKSSWKVFLVCAIIFVSVFLGAYLVILFIGISIVGTAFLVLGSPDEKRVFCDVNLHRLPEVYESWGQPDNIIEWQALAGKVATRCEKEGVMDFAASSAQLITKGERDNWQEGIAAMTVRFGDQPDSFEYGHFQTIIERDDMTLLLAGPPE